MLAELQFNGRAVVVTGAGSGIGRATAEIFGELGATLYALDRDNEALSDVARSIGSVGGKCEPVVADVTSEADVEQLCIRLDRDRVELKALVNNVGNNRIKLIEEMSLGEWNDQLSVNLTSAFMLSKSLMPKLTASGSGAIVNVSSGFGVVGGPRMPGYSAAKAGLIGLTRQLAVDYGARGVRINAVCPGLTLTERIKGYLDRELVDRAAILRRVPSGRLAQPREIGNMVAFLASDASSYVNGAVVPVDGGHTAS